MQEFKDWIGRKGVIDLAVAFIMAGAIGAVVTSLIEDIIMPLLGLILGGIDFAGLSIMVGDAEVTYGNFVQAIVLFLIIGYVMFRLAKVGEKLEPKPVAPPAGPSSEDLLGEIRDLLAKR